MAGHRPALSENAPEQQERVQQQMGAWASLTPDQRRVAREQYKSLKQLPPEERQAVREKWQEYQQLPPEKRRELARRAKAPPPPANRTAARPRAAHRHRQPQPAVQPISNGEPRTRDRGRSIRRRAGIARRLAASLYEILLLGALAVAIGLILLPLLGADAAHAGGALALPRPGRACRLVRLPVCCLWRLLHLAMERRQAHAAYAYLGSCPRDDRRRRGEPERAAVRYVAGWIGPACAIAGYLALRPYGHRRWALALLAVNYAWALVDRDRRFLHDRLAGTRLVRADRHGATHRCGRCVSRALRAKPRS